MKITRVSVFQVDLPLHEGSYKWSGGKRTGFVRDDARA